MTNLEKEIYIKGVLVKGYTINQKGEVNSYKSGSAYKIKHRISRSGYPKVTLWDKKPFDQFIHRLVAEHFVPNIENKRCVNHIDGNKHNNVVENLEWVTDTQNQIHAYRTGLQPNRKGENQPRAKLNNSKVLEIRKRRKHETGVSLAKEYGVSENTIRNIYYKRAWTHI